MKGPRDWVIVAIFALGAVVFAVAVVIGLLRKH